MKIESLGAFVPLIGGAQIGAQNATGLNTDFALSWPAFEGSDRLFTNSFGVKWYDNDQVNLSEFYADLIVAVPPCAGLSSSSRTSSAGNDKNCYMREVVSRTTKFLKPKVLIMENAPTLFSETSLKGKTLRNELTTIAEEANYVAIYIKVTTANTGVIPQFRPRTFAIFYNPGNVPDFVDHSGQRFKYNTKYQIDSLPSVEYYLDNTPISNSLEIADAVDRWKPHQDLIDVTSTYFKKELNNWYLKKEEEMYNLEGYSIKISGDITIDNLIESGYINLYRSTAFWTILTSAKYLNILNAENAGGWLDYIADQLGVDSYAYKRFSNEVRFNLQGIGKRPFSYSTTICGEYINTVFCQSLNYIRHPREKRLLTITEVMNLMGQQDIKRYPGVNNVTATQSVPSATSCMVIQDFILAESLPENMEKCKLIGEPKNLSTVSINPLPGKAFNGLVMKPDNLVVTAPLGA